MKKKSPFYYRQCPGLKFRDPKSTWQMFTIYKKEPIAIFFTRKVARSITNILNGLDRFDDE